MLEKYTGPMR